jgi:hypothetical protein
VRWGGLFVANGSMRFSTLTFVENDNTVTPEIDMSDLTDRINDIRSTVRPRPMFTLEPGRGETYRHRKPTLYAHSIYERSSVLAGQPRRLFVEGWDNWDEARAALAEVRRADRSFHFVDFGEGGGTTHIASEVLTRHLPEDDDW